MSNFYLEKAFSGENVITRAGDIVSQLTRFQVTPSLVQLGGVARGSLFHWNADGTFFGPNSPSIMDLFMAEGEEA